MSMSFRQLREQLNLFTEEQLDEPVSIRHDEWFTLVLCMTYEERPFFAYNFSEIDEETAGE